MQPLAVLIRLQTLSSTVQPWTATLQLFAPTRVHRGHWRTLLALMRPRRPPAALLLLLAPLLLAAVSRAGELPPPPPPPGRLPRYVRRLF